MLTKKCAHPACNCEVDDDTKYCSQYCEDAGGTEEISCNCTHAGCSIADVEPLMAGSSLERRL